MKVAARILFVSVFVCAILLAQAPTAVTAKPAPPTPLAGGGWEYSGAEGLLVPLDLEANPAPNDLQVMDWKMLKIDKPVQVCHPFRAGQFGWTASLFELKNSKWVKVPTTQGMIPEVDGRYMACANLPEAGTYALFGGFSGPSGEASIPNCPFEIDAYLQQSIGNPSIFWMRVNFSEDIGEDVAVSYALYNVIEPGSVLTGLTGSTNATGDHAWFSEWITFGQGFQEFWVEVTFPDCVAYDVIYD